MTDTSDNDGLSPPLAMRCVGIALRPDEEDEEKTNDGVESTNRRKPRRKERHSDVGVEMESGEISSDSDSDDSARSQRLHKRPGGVRETAVRSPVASSALAMRSPSRLAASLLVGRDRMARAARAWRDGARRAGLFPGDDDEEEEEDIEREEKQNDPSVVRTDDAERTINAAVVDSTMPSSTAPTDLNTKEPVQDEPRESTVSSASHHLSIPRLVLARVVPATRLPKMTQLWAFLDRIEYIMIREVFTSLDDDDSGPTVYYVLDVYNYQEQHSLPTHRYRASSHNAISTRRLSMSQSPPLRKPDYHIQHRYSSFTKLRNRILKASHLKHPRPPNESEATRAPSTSYRHCVYCHQVAVYIATGSDTSGPLDWRTKLFTTVEMRKTLLSQFISELVFLAREQRDLCSNLTTLTALQQPPSRYVHRSVPGILRRFLTVQTGENFMR